jgi:hypothetical protein
MIAGALRLRLHGGSGPSEGFALRHIGKASMIKRLIGLFAIATLALVSSGDTTRAASLVTFAYNADGTVLEYYPATAAKFSAQGRDFVNLTVKETSLINNARTSTDIAMIVDCQSRLMAASLAKDTASPYTVRFKNGDLKPPSKGMYERFVIAVCEGELLEVQVLPAKAGWKHFIEGASRALYFVDGSLRETGKYRAVSVRLYELGGAQLPDGRRIDARDAVWIFDCEQKLGAVAYERAFARVDGSNQTVESMGDERLFADPSVADVGGLKFAQASPDSLQARFAEDICARNLVRAASAHTAEETKRALGEVAGELQLCSVYYMLGWKCTAQDPAQANTYRDMSDKVARLAISTGRSVGVSDEAYAATVNLRTQTMIKSIGTCTNIDVLHRRYSKFCLRLNEGADPRTKEWIACARAQRPTCDEPGLP